jgi:bifunctional non-homologous end joining protein LigD
MRQDQLNEYNKKRNFTITGEPKGKLSARKAKALAFVIQKHGARRLHYDFRLELDGAMKSWAVTRGPSYDPADKRLAVQTEDHPISYNKFEGIIPEKQYGAGPVMIWDNGTWIPEGDPHKSLKKGHLTFTLKGSRMHGRWHLVRMHTKGKRDNWLLIKGDDDHVLRGKENEEFLGRENTSVISTRTLEEINGKETKNSHDTLQRKYPGIALATLVQTPPTGPDWWHEIKYDGYRILAFVENHHVRLRTRGGLDWTHKFPVIARELGKLKIKSAVIDGEAGVTDARGTTNFSSLQAALTEGKTDKIEAWFFDLLYLNGEDYAGKPLSARKKALEKLLPKKNTHIHYSAHVESSPGLLEKACKIGAEGLVSKNKLSTYHARRTHDWLKSKCGLEQEFIICGFMPAKDDLKAIGALLLGYYKGRELHYAGKVGTGYSTAMARDIYKKLYPLKVASAPFPAKVPRGPRGYVWVKPDVLCQIKFWEWTPDGHIRHASFKGLREDKSPKEVSQETPEKKTNTTSIKKVVTKKTFTVEGVTITHPDREVYPGVTKGVIAGYYAKAMPYMLPFAENRLLSLLRCTESAAGECFFQRGPMKGMGEHIFSVTDAHKEREHHYLYIKSPQGLMELMQMNVLEFHAWQSTVKNIGKPNQIIFDLDPAEDVPFDAVKLAAIDVRRRLKDAGLISFPRLTGGKGIHVVVPIKPSYKWDIIKSFSQTFALTMQREVPQAYTATMSKQKRKGRIFVDYLRNEYSSTAIVPFSLRARKGAPIAVPVTWGELENLTSAAAFTITNIDERLNKKTLKMNDEFLSLHQTINGFHQ